MLLNLSTHGEHFQIIRFLTGSPIDHPHRTNSSQVLQSHRITFGGIPAAPQLIVNMWVQQLPYSQASNTVIATVRSYEVYHLRLCVKYTINIYSAAPGPCVHTPSLPSCPHSPAPGRRNHRGRKATI